MILEKVLPVTAEGWDGAGVCEIVLYDVTFTEDFGIIKNGEKFNAMYVSYSQGIIELYEGEDIIHTINFKAAII